MKILVFVNSFGSITTTFIYNEIIELSKHHDVLVICCERGSEEKYPFDSIIKASSSENRISKKIKWMLYKYNIRAVHYNYVFKKEINKVIESFKPDVIHGHFGNESMLFFGNLHREYFNIPAFVSFHGYDATSELKNRPIYVQELKSFFNGNYPRKAICCSEYLRNNLINSGVPLTQNNSDLLYYGIKTDHFSRKKRTGDGTYRFLQVSSFREKKGHIYTLKAFSDFLKDNNDINTELILAGGGPLLEEIKEAALQMNISKYVHFPGWVNHQQAQELLEKANCFVHHSVTATNGDTEGMPNAIIEAMAMELPILSTVHAGIPEIIEHGVNGYLVEERDVNDYSKFMRQIIDWSYIEKNRIKVRERHSIISHYEKLNDIYNSSL